MSANANDLNNSEIRPEVEKEQELARRELELDRREQGISDSEQKIARREQELRTKEVELADKENALEKVETRLNAKEESLNKRDSELTDKELEFESEQADRRADQDMKLNEIRERELGKIDEARNNRLAEIDTQCAEQKRKTAEECEAQRKNTAEYCENLRTKALEQCERIRHDAEQQMSEWRGQQSKEYLDALEQERKLHAETITGLRVQLDVQQVEFNRQRTEFEREKIEYEENKSKLERQREDLKFEQMLLDNEKENLRRRIESQNDEVEKKADAKASGVKAENAALEEQCTNLREQITDLRSRYEAAETLENTIGLSADLIQKQILEYKSTIRQLENDLASRPSANLLDEHEKLKKKLSVAQDKKSELELENAELRNANVENCKLQAEVNECRQQMASLENTNAINEREIIKLNEIIKRLQSSSIQSAERIDRIRSLFDLQATQAAFANEGQQPTDEIEWLDGIRKNCNDIDMVFPKRIIYAFHTALKCADWSTVTVLAGVSGTGKSELPRLYSAFGGINFYSASVQPNWDSQESMLGYFNSIDNRFDAQPLLRFLVRGTEIFDKRDEEMTTLRAELGEGFISTSDCVNLALLDEMNLAHVEHYFADFLSKLESRRGKGKGYVPKIEVKLGAGIRPYELRLSRNVLWAGTMNQDETTKSLSDKVLDRGIIINFPRPRVLRERKRLDCIDAEIKNRKIPALKFETWKKWQKIDLEELFSEEQYAAIADYKSIVENINNELGEVGRALGHRVWQSIQYYIANYPDVIAALKDAGGELTIELKKAMHTAFEDQIVQKIMPKLRGIETRGDSKKCLDNIMGLLEINGFGNLRGDFDNACRLGYGQFMWCTANYIEADEETGSDI